VSYIRKANKIASGISLKMRILKVFFICLFFTLFSFAQSSDGILRFKAKIGFDDPKERIVAQKSIDNGSKILLVGTKNIQLWDVENGKLLESHPHQIPNLQFLKFSPDMRKAVVIDMFSERIFTKQKKVSASVWDLQTGKQIAVLERPTESIRDAEWSENGETLVTYSGFFYSKRTEVCFWDGDSFKFRGAMQLKGSIEYKKLLRTGEIFLAKTDRLESNKFKYRLEDFLTAWDTATAKPLQNFSSGTDRQSGWLIEILTKDEKFAAMYSGAFDRTRVAVWKIGGSDLPVYEIFPRKKGGTFRFFGAVGNYLALYQDKTIEFYNSADGKLKFSIPDQKPYSAHPRTFSLLPDGQTLVIESCEKAEFFDLVSGQKKFEIDLVCKTDFDLVSTSYRDWDMLSFHPSKNLLLTFSDKTVRVWNSETGKLEQTLFDPERAANKRKDENKDDGLTWSAGWLLNGKYVYARGAGGNSLLLWEMTK